MKVHESTQSEVRLSIKVFPAGGVMWVVSQPTGLSSDTVWPGMMWIETLAPSASAEAGPDQSDDSGLDASCCEEGDHRG